MVHWGGGRTEGPVEIHPCVLKDIGPLGPLPKKEERTEGTNEVIQTAKVVGKRRRMTESEN